VLNFPLEIKAINKLKKSPMKKILFLIFILFGINLIAQEQNDLEFFLKGAQVTDITSDGSNFWFATNGNGIFKYIPGSNAWMSYSTSNGNLLHDFFYCIAANKDFVWAGSTDGLFILDIKRDTWTKRKFGLGGQLANWIRALAFDKYENVLWIGRFKYLTKFDLKDKRYSDYDLTVGKNDKTNNIKTIQVDGDSLVWFGTEAGLHKYDKSKDLNDNKAITFYDTKYNFFDGEGEQVSITSLLIERKNIWIGLDEFITPERPEFNLGGLFRFNRRNDWQRFDDKNGLPANGIYDLERTGNYIWVSLYQFGKSTKESFGRGMILIDRLNNQVIPVRDERIPNTVYCIFFDGTNLWLGTESGLIKVNFFNKLAQWMGVLRKESF
jgi:ligand-binding sensor domain-containing protein